MSLSLGRINCNGDANLFSETKKIFWEHLAKAKKNVMIVLCKKFFRFPGKPERSERRWG
ncbi:hypothetical protein HMPREF1986_00876 [Oribacterium sp. oral taxon 078 str. F0263]|nr:hypothetical protein HMPREF1986_00876 [Oribacterium sp. oral taxon 078 str. F0263]